MTITLRDLADPYPLYGELRDRSRSRVAVEKPYARFPHVGVDVTKGERTRSPFTRGRVGLPATGLSGR